MSTKKTPTNTLTNKKARRAELKRISAALLAELQALSTIVCNDSVQVKAKLDAGITDMQTPMKGLGAAVQNVTRAVQFVEENLKQKSKRPVLTAVESPALTTTEKVEQRRVAAANASEDEGE